jgi:hypothetical protein
MKVSAQEDVPPELLSQLLLLLPPESKQKVLVIRDIQKQKMIELDALL